MVPRGAHPQAHSSLTPAPEPAERSQGLARTAGGGPGKERWLPHRSVEVCAGRARSGGSSATWAAIGGFIVSGRCPVEKAAHTQNA